MRVLATATLAVAVLGGCGKSTTTGSGSAENPKPSKAADNGVAALAPTEILSRSQAALAKAGSVHISGSGTSDGQTFKIDMKIQNKKGATGSLTLPVGSDQGPAGGVQVNLLIVDQTAYIKPADPNFWTVFGGGAPAVERLKGKWVKAGVADEKLQFLVAFGDLTALSKDILKPQGSVTKGAQKEINGTKTIGLQDSGSDKGTFYIATEGEPLPVQLVQGGKDTGTIDFLDYDQPVDVAAPPADQVVDGKEVGLTG